MADLTIQDKEYIWDESRKIMARRIENSMLEDFPSLIPLYAEWEKKLWKTLCEITQEYFNWYEGE